MTNERNSHMLHIVPLALALRARLLERSPKCCPSSQRPLRRLERCPVAASHFRTNIGRGCHRQPFSVSCRFGQSQTRLQKRTRVGDNFAIAHFAMAPFRPESEQEPGSEAPVMED